MHGCQAADEGKIEVTPEQFGQCRQALGLSKVRFGDLLGIGRVTVSHYERGYRHDNGRPVSIPHPIEMACAALMLGVRDFQDLYPHRVIEDVIPDHEERLRFEEIPAASIAAARKKLVENGHALSEHCVGFRVITAVRRWNAIRLWAARHNIRAPQLYFAHDDHEQIFALIDLLEKNFDVALKFELG